MVDTGFARDGYVLNSLRPPIPWDNYPRPFRFHLHAWDPINDLLATHSRLNSQACLEAAAAYAFDWLKRYQASAFAKGPAEIASEQARNPENFAWYDMAVGMRIYRLAYLAEVIIRGSLRPAEECELLLQSLRFHHEILADPSIFRGHTNHGLYQALAQLAASRRLNDLLPSGHFQALAQERLRKCLSEHFFADEGVHAEHSPGYHRMVLGSLLGASEAGLLEKNQEQFLARAERALMWMIMPNGSLAPFGDTDHGSIRQDQSLARQYQDPYLCHALTAGASGEPPPSGVQAYKTAGYAFARIYSREGGANPAKASYLAQLAAYHSRVHKHADHLTFVWSEGTVPILTDPGRFGYLGRTTRGDGLYEQGFWYSDPRRVYVESTRAHNCVEIDGRSHPRLKTAVFGSALAQADVQDGLVVFDSKIVLRPSLVHRRTLILAPGEFLIVVDWLFDRRGASHDFRQWFQLAPGWSVNRVGEGYEGQFGDVTLHAVDLLGASAPSEVMVGQNEPSQGWTSVEAGSLTPSPSFHFARCQSERSTFATLFSLNGRPDRDPMTRTNSSISRAVLAWRTPAGAVQLDLARGEQLTVKRRSRGQNVSQGTELI
ncbi:heparinase II/III family protein [uncultured Reyranella sp.]|uniref:heparinase II/III domain-containing protein n=1 Tax=uncultured Reyranella sp. TaxID=735512 RepID=UPI0025E4D3FA|nr:heparinase II/III family protein [uncultured Reyranella sp.]